MLRAMVLGVAALAATQTLAVQTASAQRLHLVILADTNDPAIGRGDAIDMRNIKELFAANVPPRQLRVTTLSGNSATRGNTLQAIQSLGVNAGQDTVVFYYTGHGGFVRERNDHVLVPNKQHIYRGEIRTAIRQMRPRLAVLLTDTCSSFVPAPPPVGAAPPGESVTPLFRALFFEARGLVDISCTKPGQTATSTGEGSYFTNALRQCLSDNQRRESWSTILDELNKSVLEAHPNAKQMAYAVSPLPGTGGADAGNADGPLPALPTPGAQPGHSGQGIRFGVAATQTQRSRQVQGVEVTQVMPGYPGTSLRSTETGRTHMLIAGQHVITHINGQPVTTYEGFSQAIDNSPRQMTLRVYNLQTGTHREYEATLRQ